MRRAWIAAGAVGAGALLRAYRVRQDPIDLAGRAALVTGASRGLGFLIARELVRQGCRVAIVARDRAELERAQADLEAEGGEVLAVAGDVAEPGRMEEAVRLAWTHFGALDVLVNNAGVIQVGPLEAMTREDFQRCLDIMFWGVVNPTLAILPLMRQRRFGRILNVTSIGGKVAAPHILPYAAAKFAAVGFSEGARAELARDGIAVTTAVPGLMRTGSFLNADFKGSREREFTWFALSDSLPLLSMDAEKAARRLVLAARRGEAEVTLTLAAKAGARLQGLFPGLTADLLGIANRLLPAGSGAAAPGRDLQAALDSRLLRAATALSQSAARRYHQLPEGNGLPPSASPTSRRG